MYQYFVRRLLLAMVTLLLITFVVYGLIRLMPGDPLLVNLEAASPDRVIRLEEIERMREIFGLNDPWYVAYWHWLTNVAQGDFGDSLSRPARVIDVIGQRIAPPFVFTLVSTSFFY